MSDEQPIIAIEDLPAALEALLFVASGAVTSGQLAEALGYPAPEVESALAELDLQYQAGRGMRLQWHNGRVQLTSASQFAPMVEKFLGLEATARLSRAGLEALAIIAYRQPITRPAIDAIRGVNSDGVIKSLLSKGLIQEIGRAEGPGRPILYCTTADFLQHFGLGRLEELPLYETAEAEEPRQELLKD